MSDQSTTFNKGDIAAEAGNYVCVPCGFRKHFKQGEQFSECMSCLSGTKHGDEEYAEGLELWEKAQDTAPEPATK